MESLLKKVEEFVISAHGDQRRKFVDEIYAAHLIRVMNICKAHFDSVPVLAAALLHDVIEDTSVNANSLKNYLESVMSPADAYDTLKLVIELTDIYTKQNHPRLNRKQRRMQEADRLSKVSAEAQSIKYADIIDNCRGLSNAQTDFAPVFLRECEMVVSKLTRGNTVLRQEAIDVIKREQKLLGSS